MINTNQNQGEPRRLDCLTLVETEIMRAIKRGNIPDMLNYGRVYSDLRKTRYYPSERINFKDRKGEQERT
jgi:hypothetical protein